MNSVHPTMGEGDVLDHGDVVLGGDGLDALGDLVLLFVRCWRLTSCGKFPKMVNGSSEELVCFVLLPLLASALCAGAEMPRRLNVILVKFHDLGLAIGCNDACGARTQSCQVGRRCRAIVLVCGSIASPDSRLRRGWA
ncbi:MAG: hypothetical protein L6R48_01075 [Planctomycetes bacterium]|nr:hypothetical protein [Planctomycetota bacterium]